MVGVGSTHLKDVDIFDLLGLDPYKLRKLANYSILKEVRKAYYRVMLVAHPDKANNGHDIAQRLNVVKDFLYNFDNCHTNIPPRVTELVKRGCQGRVSTWNPWLRRDDPGFRKPILAYSRQCKRKTPTSPRKRRTTSQPGSSPSNPIVLDRVDGWTRSSAPYPEPSPSRPGSSPSNPIVLDRGKPADCWTRSGAPSPEPSSRESDTESVWERD